jgi:hypothetical protein
MWHAYLPGYPATGSGETVGTAGGPSAERRAVSAGAASDGREPSNGSGVNTAQIETRGGGTGGDAQAGPDVPTVVRRLPAASHSAPPAAARASVMETQPPGPLAPPAHARACTSAQRRASDPPRADPHSTTHGLFDMWCSRWNYAPALMPAACALREIVLGLSRHPARCGLFGSALVLVAVANGRLDLLFSLFAVLGTMAFADVWPFAHCCGERRRWRPWQMTVFGAN